MAHPLFDLENTTKTKLAAGRVTQGYFLLTASPIIAEACSTMPIDWLIVDAEASPVSHETVVHVMQALTATGVTPMVRVRWLERHFIEHTLDMGAHGILVPKVDTAADARAAVDACFFPPKGRRGVNPIRASAYFANLETYLARANERTLCMVQIESREAVANVDEIAAVEGIDVLFIGVGDLASSLGQPGRVTGPAMEDAIAKVLEAAKKHGKVPGIFAYNTDLAIEYAARGFTFVALGNDIKAVRESVEANVAKFTRGH